MIEVRDESGLEAALGSPRALLFKHSPRCGTSLRALRAVDGWEADGAGVPVFLIDVVENRPLSLAVAERLGIRHESPQAILLEAGVPIWHASHGAIRAESLAARVGGTAGPA